VHECPRTPLSCTAPCGGRQLCLKGSSEVEPTKAWIQDRPSVQVARSKFLRYWRGMRSLPTSAFELSRWRGGCCSVGGASWS